MGREDSDAEAEAEVDFADVDELFNGFWAQNVILDHNCKHKSFRQTHGKFSDGGGGWYSQRHEGMVFCVGNLFPHIDQKRLDFIRSPAQRLRKNRHC